MSNQFTKADQHVTKKVTEGENINIYLLARKCSPYSQQQAADLFYISRKQLSAFETGKSLPKDDMVISMVESYDTLWLIYQHIQHNTEIGRRFFPEIPIANLTEAVCQWENKANGMSEIRNAMFAVAADGRVGEDERAIWAQICQKMLGFAGAALNVGFCE